MVDSDKVTVWVVDDSPHHRTLVEYDGTREDIAHDLGYLLIVGGYERKWSIKITRRDGGPLHVVGVAVP
jgi:hypothetical protein